MLETPCLPAGNISIDLDPQEAVVLYHAICERLDMSPLGVENMTEQEAYIHAALGEVEAKMCNVLKFDFPSAV